MEFVTENKYVIEAIFENVLLESQLLNNMFTSFNDAEKKVLMESLMLNEEFKEYIHQKISKDQVHEEENADTENEREIDNFEIITAQEEERMSLKGKEDEEDEQPTAQIEELKSA